MKPHRSILRFSMALFASCLLFGFINYVDFTRSEFFLDGNYRHGFPFTFYWHGSWVGHGFIWLGMLGDLVVIGTVGAAIGWYWKKISKRPSGQM